MVENLDPKDIFNLLDAISSKLNDILIRGIENINQAELEDIIRFNTQLEKMNLIVASEFLNEFLDSMEQLKKGNKNRELKTNLANQIHNIITSMKMFEIVITTEIVKRNLKTEIE